MYTINAKILNLCVSFAFFGEWTELKSVITFEIMCVFECVRWISFPFSLSPFVNANKYSECNKNCCRSVLCYQLRLFLSTRNSSILEMRCAFMMGAAIDHCAYTDTHKTFKCVIKFGLISTKVFEYVYVFSSVSLFLLSSCCEFVVRRISSAIMAG